MILGITGSFGSGKSTVASMFKELGAKVVDADKIVHSLIDKKTRKNLSAVVFKNKKYLSRLCRIIHPFVIKQINNSCEKYKDEVVVIDVPLLIEAGLHKRVDFVIVVKAKKDTLIKRLKEKTKLSKQEIENRMKFQLPLRKKISLADYVVNNEGLILDTEKQVKQIWEKINKRNGG